MGSGASGLAAKTREAVYVADVPATRATSRAPPTRGRGLDAGGADGLQEKNSSACSTFVRFRKDGFGQSDIVLLQLIASQAAMAIVNARLYTETLQLAHVDRSPGWPTVASSSRSWRWRSPGRSASATS
jgi:hypothetical protein